jgi:hypothetical protein
MEIEKIREKLANRILTIQKQAEEIGVEYTAHTRFLRGLTPTKNALKKYQEYAKKHLK